MEFAKIFLGAVLFGAVFLFASLAGAQTTTSGSGTVDTSTGWTGGFQAIKENSGLPGETVKTISEGFLGWILAILGFVAVIAFVVSGILYLTAAGNDGQIKTAKEAMKWSIVGVIVALLGYVVLQAVDLWLRGEAMF